MKKELIIFDLDGTLLNSIADLATATNYALAALGYPTHETAAYKFFVGNGINKLFERALPADKRNETEIKRVRSLFVPYYNEHNADLSTPYDGMTALLRQLQTAGYTLAIASNKYQEATTYLAKRYFPDIDFVAVLGQREGIPAKPDPQIIEEIMQQTGVGRAGVVYVGDSCVDMETGRNAGVDTIGVTWGFRPQSELEMYKPACIAHSSTDIWEFISSHS